MSGTELHRCFNRGGGLAAAVLLASCAPPPPPGPAPDAASAPVRESREVADGAATATVIFRTFASDSEVRALLERYSARPAAVFMYVAGIGASMRLPEGPVAREDALASARAMAARTARLGWCSIGERLESWALEPPAGWPAAARLEEARDMLARFEGARAAERAVASGAPVVFGIELHAPSGALEALRRETQVARVDIHEPDAGGGRRVPEPAVPPSLEWRPAPAPELMAAGAEGLHDRMRAAGIIVREQCDAHPRPPSPPHDTVRPPAGDRPPPSTIPPRVFPVYALGGTAYGSFRPGEPVELVAWLESRAAVDSTELVIVLPEVADARASGWGTTYARRPTGERYPALDSILTRTEPGIRHRLQSLVTFHAPGWYHVSMVARARSRPVPPEPLPTADEAFHSFWIWIAAEGGQRAPEMDLTRIPLGAESGTGPIRPSLRGRPGPAPAGTTRAGLEGTVRDAAGRPVEGAQVTVRAWMGTCPGREAAEAATRTSADGRWRVELGAEWPESFRACVAVHIDPPIGLDAAPHSDRTELRFLRERVETGRLDVVLDPAPPRPVPPPPMPAGVAVAPAPVRAYSHIVAAQRADVTGDGRSETIELSADAEVDRSGRPIWDHGHRWRLIVRSAVGDFLLLDEFLPHAMAELSVGRRAVDEPGAPPAVAVTWRMRGGGGGLRFRFDADVRRFEIESRHGMELADPR